jgi:hypothetical protein
MMIRNVMLRAARTPALRRRNAAAGLAAHPPQRAFSVLLGAKASSPLSAAAVALQRPHLRQFSDEVASVPSRKPTIQDVIDSPREYYEMPPDVLLTLAVAEDAGARTERLIREIMIVDNVSWDDAEKKMQEIAKANAGINSLQTNISKTYFKTMAFVRVTRAAPRCPRGNSRPSPIACVRVGWGYRYRSRWASLPSRFASTSTPRSGSTTSLSRPRSLPQT